MPSKEYLKAVDTLSKVQEEVMQEEGYDPTFIFISRSHFGAGLDENAFFCAGHPVIMEDIIYKAIRNDHELMNVFSRALIKAIEESKSAK